MKYNLEYLDRYRFGYDIRLMFQTVVVDSGNDKGSGYDPEPLPFLRPLPQPVKQGAAFFYIIPAAFPVASVKAGAPLFRGASLRYSK